jgi:membrane peptidoglycan carboxypeptidase
MGYTPQIVAGTWFGNADNSPIGSATSTTLSWPIMQEFMTVYHQDLSAERFTRPADLARAEVCLLSGLKPTPDCPLTTPDDLFAERALPEEDDDWWTKVSIDSRSGLLASDLTPPEFAVARFFLDLPDDLSAFERDQAQQWASQMGAVIGSPPTEVTRAEDIPVTINSPADGAQIEQRVIFISGRASSTAFKSYLLEFGAGQQPNGWRRINASATAVTNGTLGVWDARNVAPGEYTIRLTLIDDHLGEIVIQIRIRLVAAKATPTSLPPPPLPAPAPTPTATPVGEENNGPGNGPGHGPP